MSEFAVWLVQELEARGWSRAELARRCVWRGGEEPIWHIRTNAFDMTRADVLQSAYAQRGYRRDHGGIGAMANERGPVNGAEQAGVPFYFTRPGVSRLTCALR